jgi:hypothetical protein
MFMKTTSLIAFAFLTLLVAKTNAATTAFDGIWSVTVNAHDYNNPDGRTTVGWIINFPAEVKNGILHGEYGTRGAPAWYELDGTIEANGTANLKTNGISKVPEHGEKHLRPGTPYHYLVTAQFHGRQGTGKSIGPRTRILTFVKN